jgi:hypothetical protein
MTRLILWMMVCLTLPLAAFAQSQSTDTRLTQQIQDMIDLVAQEAPSNGWTFIQNEKTHWNSDREITIPSILFRDAKNIETTFPKIHATAAPETMDSWNLYLTSDLAFSSTLPDGKKAYDVSIIGSSLKGTWDASLRHLSYAKAHDVDIKVQDHLNSLVIEISDIDLQSSLTRTTPQSWAGPMQGRAASITITAKNLAEPIILQQATWSALLTSAPSQTPVPPAKIFGAITSGTLTLKGLDDANRKLQTAMITAPESNRAHYIKAVLILSALSGVGKPIEGDASSKSYDVVFGDDGQVKINGMNVSSLFDLKAKTSQ